MRILCYDHSAPCHSYRDVRGKAERGGRGRGDHAKPWHRRTRLPQTEATAAERIHQQPGRGAVSMFEPAPLGANLAARCQTVPARTRARALFGAIPCTPASALALTVAARACTQLLPDAFRSNPVWNCAGRRSLGDCPGFGFRAWGLGFGA